MQVCDHTTLAQNYDVNQRYLYLELLALPNRLLELHLQLLQLCHAAIGQLRVVLQLCIEALKLRCEQRQGVIDRRDMRGIKQCFACMNRPLRYEVSKEIVMNAHLLNVQCNLAPRKSTRAAGAAVSRLQLQTAKCRTRVKKEDSNNAYFFRVPTAFPKTNSSNFAFAFQAHYRCGILCIYIQYTLYIQYTNLSRLHNIK